MYESLKANAKDFHLYIFAFDDLTKEILVSLGLNYVTVIPLDDFETDELRKVKKERTRAEYCWTCTPSTISYLIRKYSLSHCTYIDADLIFYSDPAVLVDEMNDNKKSVLITEHRYSWLPQLYEEKRSGRFCVQFITFTREKDSLEVLDKWRRQCIDWCFSRHEDGKFGDQKYLDDWPVRYSNIHILLHQGGGVAPWNITRYKFRKEQNSIGGTLKNNQNTFDVVFYHFQYVKFLKNGQVDIGWYYIQPKLKKLVYLPYLEKVSEIEKMLKETFPGYKSGITEMKADNFKNLLKVGFKKIFGYNILNIN